MCSGIELKRDRVSDTDIKWPQCENMRGNSEWKCKIACSITTIQFKYFNFDLRNIRVYLRIDICPAVRTFFDNLTLSRFHSNLSRIR